MASEFVKNGGEAIFGPNADPRRGEAFALNSSPDGTKLVYGSGGTVVIRDFQDTTRCAVYTGHKAAVRVAKFSPDGKWIASGDEKGQVHIFDASNPDKEAKKQMTLIGGPIFDVSWDESSKRLCVAGNAKGTVANVLMWESGSGQGELKGPTKGALTCDIRKAKPCKLVLGTEDFSTYMYAGPPFKFSKSMKNHKNFVQCARFSPDGDSLATVSNDGTIQIYDGESGDLKKTIAKEHKGSIYQCAWSPDSEMILTASGDKTCKLWNAASGKCEQTFAIAAKPTVKDMQVGCTFCGENPVSLSLSGELNFLDLKSGQVSRKVNAQSSSVVSLCTDFTAGIIYGGTQAGAVYSWKPNGEASVLEGESHSANALAVSCAGDTLFSVGFDDTIRAATLQPEGALEYDLKSATTGGQPVGVSNSAAEPHLAVTATASSILLFRDGAVTSVIEPKKFEFTAVAMSADGKQVAAGDSKKMVRMYNIVNDKLQETDIACELSQKATCIAFSPNSEMFAVGDETKEITLWNKDGSAIFGPGVWVYHTGRITALAWSPSSAHLATVGLDGELILWNPSQKRKKTKIPRIHRGGGSAVTWLDDATVYTAGFDGCIKAWSPKLP